jgi:signal transduction histidine kinase
VSDVAPERCGRRLLLLAPNGRDAALAGAILQDAGIETNVCASLESLVGELANGAGAILVAEEALASDESQLLAAALSQQPTWSDLPVLILTYRGADSAATGEAIRTLGNVALLERPTRVAALVSAVRAALRARERQYQLRAYLLERERTEDALRDADRRKDEFLATLAHELRNPLAPISNALHVLKLTHDLDTKAERMCEMMERQVSHMVRLVDDLLEVSRITRGKIALRRELVALDAILRGAIETTRPLIDGAEHEVILSLPDEALVVYGDPVRLGQVFANLLNNAAKYTATPGRIRIGARQDGDRAVVSVRDSGIGIPPALLARVFDMFMQVPRPADQQHGGLGIGLTLVRNLVEMHGGTVRAFSEGPGRGTEIVVRLPLSSERRRPADVDAPAARAKREVRRRVLVVDDNRDAADSFGMLLELIGADVRVVHDGATALRALEEFAPTIVVLDIGMPGMDGYEVARRIRQQPRGSAVTLVALTGWGQEEDRRRCRMAGFDHHLTKPVDIDVFETLMSSLDGEHGPHSVAG